MEQQKEEVNLKTRYRPFKRNFKIRLNDTKKSIKRAIKYITYRKTEPRATSNSRSGRTRVTYASIKGCCGLKRNGYLY